MHAFVSQDNVLLLLLIIMQNLIETIVQTLTVQTVTVQMFSVIEINCILCNNLTSL